MLLKGTTFIHKRTQKLTQMPAKEGHIIDYFRYLLTENEPKKGL